MKPTQRIVISVLGLFLAAPVFAAEKKIVVPPESAPKPGSPAPTFSPGVLVDGTLYISGQMGLDPKTRQIPENFEDEMKNTMDNIGIVLKAASMSFNDVVSVTVFLTDMNLSAKMNEIYKTYFNEPRPARALAGVATLAVPRGHIEISVTAHK